MENIYIKSNIPPVENFPNDDKLRVVWAYGALYKNFNETRVPYVNVMLTEILVDGSLTENHIFIKISVAQLDIVRYMSIWFGQQRTNKFYKEFERYDSNRLFSLDTTTAESINLLEKRSNSENHYYIPPFKYRLNNINSAKNYYNFANATFTKVKSFRNIEVIIPSMELLTSTYVPFEQNLRNNLLQYSLNDILDKYIKSSLCDDDKYHITLYENKTMANALFLAFAKFNKVSRQRLAQLRNSLEKTSVYPEKRYPVVLPYHPTSFQVQGDGIWLDDYTFLMFRINQFSLPDDNEVIVFYEDVEIEQKETERKYTTHITKEKELETEDIPITSKKSPHHKNAKRHIVSEVSILRDSMHEISYQKKIKKQTNSADVTIEEENKDNINALSSGEENYSESSKEIAKIKIDEKAKLQQSKVIYMLIDSLLNIKNKIIKIGTHEDTFIKDIYFLDENADLLNEQVETQFKRVIVNAQEKPTHWVVMKKTIKGKREFVGLRNYLILKIVLSNNQYAYILEIDRKDDTESFLGLLFHPGYEMTQDTLEHLLFQTMDNKGVVKKINFHGKKMAFKHTVQNESLDSCINKVLKKGIDSHIFGF